MIPHALLEILKAIFNFWINQKAADSIESVKVNSEIAYVQGIRTLRFAVIAIVGFIFGLGLFVLAIYFLIHAIVVLQPWDARTFAIYFGAGSLLVVIATFVVLGCVLSEKFWIRALRLDSVLGDKNEADDDEETSRMR